MNGKFNISRKYALWFSAVSLAILIMVMLSVSVVFWKGADTLQDKLREGSRESFEKTQDATMYNLAEYLRGHIGPPLYQLDIEELNKLIHDLRRGLPVKSFRIADATGTVLTDGTKENSSYGLKLSVDEKQLKTTPVMMQKSAEGYRVVFWVGIEGYTIGYGEIILSDVPLKQALAQQEKAVIQIWQGFTAKFMTITLLAVLCIGLIAGVVSVWVSKTFSLPLVRLSDATKKIAAGDLAYRVGVDSDDEVGELARSFNTMVEDLQRGTAELAEMNRALQGEIQERTTMEFALAEEKERLAVTLHSIADGVITTDMAGGVLLINTVAEALTGWQQEEVFGKPIQDLFSIFNEETSEPLENPVDVVWQTGTIIESASNTTFKDRSGKAFSIAHSCAPIKDSGNKVIGTVLVFRDITERQKMEKELLKIQKLESVGILAGGIAHDFNNILTGIIGNISLAKMYVDKANSEKAAGKLEDAEKAALRAKDLTQQLLTFSKGGAPIRKNVSIGELIMDCAEFALTGSNVKCTFLISPELWPAHIDEGQINQVIQNLIINADQAMPQGGLIRIGVSNVVVTPDSGLPLKAGDYIKISVEDQGAGIAKEHLAKIFDPYFTTKEKGEGLGLATTYSIIKNHNGYITVESKRGVGTTFFIYLPASQDDVVKPETAEERALAGQGRILVMDDGIMIQNIAREMLHNLGYEVEVAGNGDEAIQLFQSAREAGAPFDAVIMDLTIPGGMGGKETVKQLYAIDQNVRAIVSSGYSNDPIMANYHDYGFSGVVTKPYNFQELASVLHDVLQMKQQA